MKKFLEYLASGFVTFLMCVCLLCCFATEPGNERLPYSFGAAICFLVALLFAGLGNSLKWDGTKIDEDSE